MNGERPQSVVQATGEVAGDIVGGLKANPMLLAIVVLNVVAIAIAGWIGLKFLEAVERGDAAERTLLEEIVTTNRSTLLELLRICFPGRDIPMPEPGRRGDKQIGPQVPLVPG